MKIRKTAVGGRRVWPTGHLGDEDIMNLATLIVGMAVLLVVVLAVRSLMNDKKNGKCGGCGGNCGGCSGCH